MFIRPGSTRFAVLALLAMAFATPAFGNAQVSVKNATNGKQEVKVFDGGDAVCDVPRKTVTVDAGSTKQMSGAGNGHHRCKLKVERGHCKNVQQDCGLHTTRIRVHDGETLVVKAEGLDCVIR